MADQISDPRLETLLRRALSTEVANLTMTVRPDQILERAEVRRRARTRSRLRLLVLGEPTSGLRQMAVAMGAIAVVAMAGALAFATLGPDRINVAAPLPTTPAAWSRVTIDAGRNAGNVVRVAASSRGLLAVVDAGEGPARLLASTDGTNWTPVPPEAHPVIGGDVRWALTGTDGGFLLSTGDIWTSADGSDWRLLARRADDPDLASGEMLAIAAAGAGYVGVGTGNSAWYSEDGSDWTLVQVPPPPTDFFASHGFASPEVAMRGIAAAGDRLVAWGTASRHTKDAGLTSPVLWTSRDGGRTWADASDPTDGEGPSAMTAGPGGFVALTEDRGKRVVRVSADGSSWEQVADLGEAWWTAADGTPLDLDVSAIATSDAGFVAIGGLGPRCLMAGVPCGPDEAVLWTSTDGRSWSRLPNVDPFTSAGASDIVFWGDRFVVGGAQGGKPAIWISGRD